MSGYSRTLAKSGSIELEIKKSRFICTVAPAQDEAEARHLIDRLKKQYWDANHNCFAMRIGPGGSIARSSDDGEPAGTAGAPILSVLTKRNITNCVAVVTRYFGGTLLGAGGLIRAYGQATSDAVMSVGIVEMRPLLNVLVSADSADAGRLEHAMRSSGWPLSDVEYAREVTLALDLEPERLPEFEKWLSEFTKGAGRLRVAGESLIPVPVTE